MFNYNVTKNTHIPLKLRMYIFTHDREYKILPLFLQTKYFCFVLISTKMCQNTLNL